MDEVKSDRVPKSFAVVDGRNKFDHWFVMGDVKSQKVLREIAKDVVIIQLYSEEKIAVNRQFSNLPKLNVADPGPLVYYGDDAKFVARHLNLMFA